MAVNLLIKCEPWYLNSSISECLFHENGCQAVPSQCQDNLIFDTFFALVPTSFNPSHALADDGRGLHVMRMEISVDRKTPNFKDWTYDLHTDYLLPLYYSTDVPGKGGVELAAYSMHSKYAFFGRALLGDVTYAGLAFGFVFIMIWIHSGSFFVSSFAFVQIIAALGVALLQAKAPPG